MPRLYPLSALRLAHHIRLVDLLPARHEDPLQCALSEYPLNDAPSYEALSYAWNGDHTKGNPILTLNGHLFPVTSELESALRRLRRADVPRTMWVDWICINQADFSERSAQVSLMKEIYRGAKRVVVWIGEESESSGRALAFIKEMAMEGKRQLRCTSINGVRQGSDTSSECGDGTVERRELLSGHEERENFTAKGQDAEGRLAGEESLAVEKNDEEGDGVAGEEAEGQGGLAAEDHEEGGYLVGEETEGEDCLVGDRIGGEDDCLAGDGTGGEGRLNGEDAKVTGGLTQEKIEKEDGLTGEEIAKRDAAGPESGNSPSADNEGNPPVQLVAETGETTLDAGVCISLSECTNTSTSDDIPIPPTDDADLSLAQLSNTKEASSSPLSGRARYEAYLEATKESRKRQLEAYLKESDENDKRWGHLMVGYPVLYYDLGCPYWQFFKDDRQPDWEALDELLARPWWSRTWVVQEVWHSSNAVIQCGNATLKWKTFEKAMNYKEGWDDIGCLVKDTARWSSWEMLKRRYGLAVHISKRRLLGSRLSDLLWNMWDREATDPRDKVFAVLGLVGDEAHGRLSADYGKPVGQVYREAAACVIRAENSLDLLLASPGLMARDGLPTWVPDWRREANDNRPALFINGARMKTLLYYSGSTYSVHFHGHGYSASGKMEPTVRFDEDLSCIHVRGVVFDGVGEVGPACGAGVRASEIVDGARATLERSSGSCKNAEEVSDEVLSTILRAGTFVDKETLRSEDLMIESIMNKRRFFVSNGSHPCIGPTSTQPGDALSIIAGCNFPMVLRRRGEGGYLVVGEAYVHDCMAGEVLAGETAPEWQELLLY